MSTSKIVPDLNLGGYHHRKMQKKIDESGQGSGNIKDGTAWLWNDKHISIDETKDKLFIRKNKKTGKYIKVNKKYRNKTGINHNK